MKRAGMTAAAKAGPAEVDPEAGFEIHTARHKTLPIHSRENNDGVEEWKKRKTDGIWSSQNLWSRAWSSVL